MTLLVLAIFLCEAYGFGHYFRDIEEPSKRGTGYSGRFVGHAHRGWESVHGPGHLNRRDESVVSLLRVKYTPGQSSQSSDDVLLIKLEA